MAINVNHFYDPDTGTISYIVVDQETAHAAIIDPVLNYDPVSGRTSSQSADVLIEFISKNNLTLQWILETHIHADHMSAADHIKQKIGGKIGIGQSILDVIGFWSGVFNTSHDTALDGSQFDCIFKDKETFFLGKTPVQVIHTPGHTPACSSYLINDCVFVGDLFLMPDVGVGRADFPGGDAETMYQSIQTIFSLPNETKIYVCHDYPPNKSRSVACVATVKEHKEKNILAKEHTSKENFIQIRKEKDKTNTLPRLIFPSIQVNIRAGKLGQAEENGTSYVKIPLNKF